jgi:hypothetical protein
VTLGGTLDLSSPPAIGGTAAAAGTFTTLTATGQTSLGGAAGSEGLRVLNTASSVNWVQVTGATTGNASVISATGSDADVSLNIQSRTGGVLYTRLAITNGGAVNAGISASGGVAFSAVSAGSQVNGYQATGATTTKSPVFTVFGSDANISQVFQSKGTGAIDLAAGSSGVNISNGGTVTAITHTATGSGYTTVPTWTASAPTTAGGTTASGTAQSLLLASASNVTIVSGGTGYTVSDVLTIVGGTFTAAAQLTVTSVSSGVITGISVPTNGTYTVAPTNPVSVTGGTGSSATFNLSLGIRTGLTISVAGSGYVEQPTVTFSGGGGSGAAAYATVGSGAIIKALGVTGTQSLDFYTPASSSNAVPAFRISNATATAYPMTVYPTTGFSGFLTQGDANGIFIVGANGSGSIRFTTAGTTYTEQMRVSHTASAVNYVQVTGAATGGAAPIISTQGSDSNITLGLQSKGSAAVALFTNTKVQFDVFGGGSVVNYIRVAGANTGSAPSFTAIGTDTDVSIGLVPKGLGIVLMNQQTPAAVTATGTLTIANLLTQIITSTSAIAVALTLPTGTLSDAGVSGGTSAVNTSFEYSIINLGSAVGDVTLVAGTAHTIVGSATVAVGTSGRFRCRKTATNTFVSYRV